MTSVTCSLGEILILPSSSDDIEWGKYHGWGFSQHSTWTLVWCLTAHGCLLKIKKDKLLLGYTEF